MILFTIFNITLLLYSGYMNKLRYENGYEQKIIEGHRSPIWCLRNKDEDGNTVTPIEETK